MNCLEFRRAKQADPHFSGDAALRHVAECAACQEFAARMGDLDHAIADTLNGIPVPDGLADRITLRMHWGRDPAWRRWALAAGVVLSLATALSFPLLRSDAGLARAALAHVEEEPETLRARESVSVQAVADALASVGANLSGDIGKVTFLGDCPLPGGEGKHLVVTSPYGRYSLILMSAQTKARESAKQGLHEAISKPAVRGSYAIVASSTPDLAKIERLVEQNVMWTGRN